MINDFFKAQTVAIIGASNNPEKLGNQILNNLLKTGFCGEIFPINLKEENVCGIKAHKSVLEVNSQIDFAVIVIPREGVLEVLKECIVKKIKTVLIITAGFSEKDEYGKALEKEMEKITKDSSTKIIGPNCMGIINAEKNLNLTFAGNSYLKGNLGLILQSGAIGSAIFDWAKINNIGISKFISLGNKLHITENDALEILADDPNTKYICLYLEDMENPKDFMEICRKITPKKPIIVLKGGKTDEGMKASVSHTGALSSPSALNDAFFDHSNIISAENYEDMLNVIEILNSGNFDVENKNIAILTNAGGPAILAADACSKFGLKINNMEKVRNPFDLGGDALASDYQDLMERIIKSNFYSAVIAILTPQSATEIEKTAQVLAKYKNKIILIAVFMGAERIEKSLEYFANEKIPTYSDPFFAAEMLSKLYRYEEKKKGIRERALENIEKKDLESDQIIQNYELPFAKSQIAENEKDALSFANQIGYPVVYKSKDALHRGKAGKVKLDIVSDQILREAIQEIGLPGIVQKMEDSPFEIILGAKRDPSYGVSILIGKGGIFAEEINQILIKILPLSDFDINDMINFEPIKTEILKLQVTNQLKKLILNLSKIMQENEKIEVIELNPIKISDKKIIAVDINISKK